MRAFVKLKWTALIDEVLVYFNRYRFRCVIMKCLHPFNSCLLRPLGKHEKIRFVTDNESPPRWKQWFVYYNDVIMSAMASQITSLTIVYSTIYSGVDQRKHQSSASLAFVRGIHRWPVNSPHKWPVTRKMFSFDDVIICPIKSLPWLLMNSRRTDHVHM